MNTNSSDSIVSQCLRHIVSLIETLIESEGKTDSDWLRGEEGLCAYLHIKSKKTLREHVTSPSLPHRLLPSGIVGDIVYYHKKDVDKFLRTNDPNLVTAHKHAAKRAVQGVM